MHSLYTKATFQSLVDTILPRTYDFKKNQFQIIPGGVDFSIDEYIMWNLDVQLSPRLNIDDSYFILSTVTAQTLDIASMQFLHSNTNTPYHNDYIFPYGGLFTTLSRIDRLRVIMFIEKLDVDLTTLPFPYKNNPGFTMNLMNIINLSTIFGFYSEWFGYGNSRFSPSENSRLFCIPPGWIQTGYPGPALGYRDFRGFLLEMDYMGGIK
ncbi:hypothetical protein ACERII_16810 [Evansella sp. AB-rgal1]|uniref:hypothetical protein n=1 Tax=Evansella sp. AB-rgal1 TaxID=3242696 RepID=UPI00359EFF0B